MRWLRRTDNRDCTVVINSCDAYADLWKPFVKLFNQYWPDCPYSIVMNTESNGTGIEVRMNATEKTSNEKTMPYGLRLRNCLNQIETPVVLMMLDDFFLREFVNQERVSELVTILLIDSNVNCFAFEQSHDGFDIHDGKFNGFVKRSDYGAYRYSLQACLWNRKSLIDAWKDFESPWQWELLGNMRSWTSLGGFYTLGKETGFIIDYGKTPGIWGVFRGKWVIDDVKPLFDKNNIHIDYSIRGYCLSSDVYDSHIKFSIVSTVRSIGIVRYVKYMKWKIMKKICGDRISSSYSDHLNNRDRAKKAREPWR